MFGELFPEARKVIVIDDPRTRAVAGVRVIGLLKAARRDVVDHMINPDGSDFHVTYAKEEEAREAIAAADGAIPNLGTTHADTFHTEVPLTDEIPDDRIRAAYEEATGDTIVGTFRRLKIDPDETPAALAVHHGPFTWGRTVEKAVENAVVLEEVAKMAAVTVALNPSAQMNPALVEKHYSRKHGPNAYYGQR
jgi:L-ribulose-5-phosphate 4-epimerase